jgi:hypothetical protein
MPAFTPQKQTLFSAIVMSVCARSVGCATCWPCPLLPRGLAGKCVTQTCFSGQAATHRHPARKATCERPFAFYSQTEYQ